MFAKEAARLGLSVLVLEAGGHHLPGQMTQREGDMLPKLFYDAGGRCTDDGAVMILHGKGIGGSTVHNTNLCKRAPDAVLKRWDVAFFQQRLKQARYSVDQREVRAQFPTNATIDWMMKVTSTLYGVQFRPNKSLPVWQSDVRGYDVFDGRSGQYLSSFYLDLFPRDGKYKHAAAFPIRGVSLVAQRTPVSAREKPASAVPDDSTGSKVSPCVSVPVTMCSLPSALKVMVVGASLGIPTPVPLLASVVELRRPVVAFQLYSANSTPSLPSKTALDAVVWRLASR